jgi:hypothetical protein
MESVGRMFNFFNSKLGGKEIIYRALNNKYPNANGQDTTSTN